MEVDKFEKHIKKHLNEREITPSEGAWNTLSEQLPVVAPKKNNKFIWYSVAAVFIGVLIMSTLYFKVGQTPSETQIQVVETPQEINVPKKEEDLMVPIKEEDKLVGVKKEVIQKGDSPRVRPPEAIMIKDETQVAVLEPKEVKTNMETDLKVKTNQLIDAKIAEMAVQVELLEASDFQVTDAEVDSLLRKAMADILRNNLIQDNKVDAMALLTDVEDELDQSFREHIFNSLKEKFLKTRTAFADRNN